MDTHKCTEGETIKTTYFKSFKLQLPFFYNTGSVNSLFMGVFMFPDMKYN